MRPQIEDQIAQANLLDKVRITGWISGAQVREEILASRALVLPSLGEGLPVVLMEAMALRRPVVTTFISGIPELVRSGVDGWLVPAGDADALANTLRICIEAPDDLIGRMGEAGHDRVLERHDVDVQARKLQKLFVGNNDTLRPGGPPGLYA